MKTPEFYYSITSGSRQTGSDFSTKSGFDGYYNFGNCKNIPIGLLPIFMTALADFR